MIDSSLFLGSLRKLKAVVDEILADKDLKNSIYAAIEMVVVCLQAEKKLLFAGNGGSAADALFAYSTSDTAPHIIKGIEEEGKFRGVKTIGMTGSKPQIQQMLDLCDITIRVPSVEIPYIQEGHLAIGPLICLNEEEFIFLKK